MRRKVTSVLVPFSAVVAAAATAGTCAWAQSALPARQWRTPSPEECAAAPTPPGATDQNDPGAFADGPGVPKAPATVALAARTNRTGDTIRYRVTVRAAREAVRDLTVTVHLRCAPGAAWIIGRPAVTAGSALARRQVMTWRPGVVKASASATFMVRVRAGKRYGVLVGELTTTGPATNCPAGTPAGRFCRVVTVIPRRTDIIAANQASPAPPAPSSAASPSVGPEPRPVPPRRSPAMPIPPGGGPGGVPPADGQAAGVPPGGRPAAGLPPGGRPAAGLPPGGGQAAGVPQVPAAPPALPLPAPGQSTLSQVDRPPLVPSGPGAPEGPAAQQAPQAAPPPTAADPVLRSSESFQEDLSGRMFAFLLGGVVFLLAAAVIAGHTTALGERLRRVRAARTSTGK